jgi:hypothetical protein
MLAGECRCFQYRENVAVLTISLKKDILVVKIFLWQTLKEKRKKKEAIIYITLLCYSSLV